MKRLILAFRAFFKAFSDPKGALRYLEGDTPKGKQGGGLGSSETADTSHLRLLTLMQQQSRLIDFIKEDLSSFDDGQVGAAVRKIHDDCNKCLEELVTIRCVVEESEGSKILIPKGYDPSKFKVVGMVKGEPPFTGILVHKGWKAHKRSLPKNTGDNISDIISPAEVEVR